MNSSDSQLFETTASADANDRVLILFATVTGNAERIAHRAAREVKRHGLSACVVDMAHCTPDILTQARHVLIVASTCGNGEPPDDTVPFYEALVHGSGWDLRGVEFSVLALGNLTFDYFCRCGRELDAALERHRAARFYPRVDCDADYDQPAKHWIEGVTEALRRQEIVARYAPEPYKNIFGETPAMTPGYSSIN